ncbi:MAG: rhomboid family intramembrane serine protease [Myxococcaceae bacterium]|nr:rhomboid family intramembrane serine protease [Myxococcaceae bacterium]
MATCPDHPRELAAATPGRACPFCRGVLLTTEELEHERPGAGAVLEVEGRDDALPFKKPRRCPDCGGPMTPLRIGRLEAWVEKCAACELLWVERGDLTSLALVTKTIQRQDAWASMDSATRAEAAKELADVPERAPQPTLGQTAQALVGLPVLGQLEGAQPSVATWVSLGVLVAVFAGGLAAPDVLGFEALAWRRDRDSLMGLFPAVLAHDGWAHVIGNLVFAWLFGDAVERKSPHWLMPAMLFGGGALSLLIDSFFTPATVLIGGASGGVFGLMGLTLVLQRRGRWMIPLAGLRTAFLPLPFVMVLYVALDVWVASSADSGIAWIAHAAGFGLGALAGVAAGRSQRGS